MHRYHECGREECETCEPMYRATEVDAHLAALQAQHAEAMAKLNRLLGWVYQRSRTGCFSKNRSERDQALADVNFHLSKFRDDYVPVIKDPRSTWTGDSP